MFSMDYLRTLTNEDKIHAIALAAVLQASEAGIVKIDNQPEALTQKEAAKFLNISLRTFQRYALKPAFTRKGKHYYTKEDLLKLEE